MILKIVLVGEETDEIEEFFTKHCGQNFPPSPLNKLGIAISVKKLKLKDEDFGLQIYKISKEEQFQQNAYFHFQLSQGGIIIFDAADKYSLYKNEKYIKQILEFNEFHFVPLVLIGINADVELDSSEKVSEDDVIAFFSFLIRIYHGYNFKIAYFPSSKTDDSYAVKSFNFLAESNYTYYTNLFKVLCIGDRYVGVQTFFKNNIYIASKDGKKNTGNLGEPKTNVRDIYVNDKRVSIEFTRVYDHIFLEKYEPETLPMLYKRSCGGIIMFDVTNRQSFQKVDQFLNEFLENNTFEQLPLVILGSKVDLRQEFPDSVSDQEAEEYCAQKLKKITRKGIQIKYFPYTAKTNLNAENCLSFLAECLHTQQKN